MEMEAPGSDPLEPFYDEGLIVGMLGALKPGKEAMVYVCEAHPNTGAAYFAAKVYRERIYRSFRNDAIYQEGANPRRSPPPRLENKSETGREVQFSRWTGHEFAMLTKAYAAGADVPRPVSRTPGPAILMEYVGDTERSAPLLKSVRLAPEDVQPTFDALLHNIELFLQCGFVHADLSPFNILFWRGGVKIIDFPQAVQTWIGGAAQRGRPLASCFATLPTCAATSRGTGWRADATGLTEELWERHVVPPVMRGVQ